MTAYNEQYKPKTIEEKLIENYLENIRAETELALSTKSMYSSAAWQQIQNEDISKCGYYTERTQAPAPTKVSISSPIKSPIDIDFALSEPVNAYTIAASAPIVNDMVFCADGKECVRIRSDGSVQLGEGVSLDEASRAFWKRLQETGMFGQAFENDITDTYSPALNQMVEFITQISQSITYDYYQDLVTGKAFVVVQQTDGNLDEQERHNNNYERYERAMKVVR